MPDNFSSGGDAGPRSGVDRAAIFLLTLGEKEAADILRHMSPLDVQRVGCAMAQIADVSRDEVTEVVSGFIADAERQTSLGTGNAEFVRKALIDAMGEHQAAGLLDQILLGRASKGLESLKWMEPKAVVDLIRHEHPQIIAFVLAYLDAAKASRVLGLLPEPMHGELMLRVATMEGIQPAALQELDQVMERQFAAGGPAAGPSFGGAKAVADILNALGPKAEPPIMSEINAADEVLGAQIQDLMYTFDDLLGLEDRAMQEVLRQVPSDRLLIALKAAEDNIKEKIFKNMSQRAAETLREDLEARGPVRLAEGESAQKEITGIARRLADEGTINLGSRGGEAYV